MITTIALGLCALSNASLPTALPPAPAPVAASFSVVQDDHTKLIADAGEDVEKILELARTWKKDGKAKESKAAFERVVEIDPKNEEARKGLRHKFYDGKWFKTYSELSKYRREETKRMEAKGFAKHGDEWVRIEDLPYLRTGLVKGEDGVWRSPREIAREAAEKKLLEEGCQLRAEDSSWIHPDDFDKWKEGLWKCGEDWVDVAKANEFHSQIGRWWHARGEHFEVLCTCDMDTLLWVRWHADKAFQDLVRIYGIQPDSRPPVVVFNSIDQFNMFAAGDQAAQLPPSENSGFSSLHYAYFADSWYNGAVDPPEYLGTGVAYWDANDPALAPFGKHSVRHAAGLAYLQAICPSLMTISEAIAGGAAPDLNSFWAEKKVPRWLGYGAAAYAERYYKDEEAADPWAVRKWAISNLKGQGKFDKLDDIFEFELTLDDIPGSTKMISEAGLLVSFILDGECQPVIDAHAALKAALKSGEGADKAVENLQKVLKKNEKKLKKYADL